MKKKILIPIETTAREFKYKLVLSVLLSSKGFECYIGSKKLIQSLFNKVKPFIYLDKGYHENVSEKIIYHPIKNNGGLIINLDEEGGVDSADFHALNRRIPDEIVHFFERVFIWGKEQKKFLKMNKANYNNKKFIVSGHPRFDLLKEKYNFLYESEIQDIKKRYNSFILINTMNKFSNHARGYDFLKKNYAHRIKKFDERVQYDEQKLNTTNKLINCLIENLNHDVVIRPHPEENFDFYRRKFNYSSKVHVEGRFSVVPWLKACDLMIHHDCTTAIEYAMLGKTSIAFIEKYNENIIFPAPVKASYLISKTDELVNFIKEKKFVKRQNNDNILEKYFSISKESTDIIVNEIQEVAKIFNNEDNIDISYVEKISYKISHLITYLKSAFIDDEILKKNKLQNLNNFNFVNDLARIIANGFKLESVIKVKKIDINLYKITSS